MMLPVEDTESVNQAKVVPKSIAKQIRSATKLETNARRVVFVFIFRPPFRVCVVTLYFTITWLIVKSFAEFFGAATTSHGAPRRGCACGGGAAKSAKLSN